MKSTAIIGALFGYQEIMDRLRSTDDEERRDVMILIRMKENDKGWDGMEWNGMST